MCSLEKYHLRITIIIIIITTNITITAITTITTTTPHSTTVVVVELPQTAEDDLRSARPAHERSTIVSQLVHVRS